VGGMGGWVLSLLGKGSRPSSHFPFRVHTMVQRASTLLRACLALVSNWPEWHNVVVEPSLQFDAGSMAELMVRSI
jgi:hypothetical protein